MNVIKKTTGILIGSIIGVLLFFSFSFAEDEGFILGATYSQITLYSFDQDTAEEVIFTTEYAYDIPILEIGKANDRWGIYISKDSNILSSYQLKDGIEEKQIYTADDYEYIEGLGDLDECNGMWVDTEQEIYGYFITELFPYIPNCFNSLAVAPELPEVSPSEDPITTPEITPFPASTVVITPNPTSTPTSTPTPTPAIQTPTPVIKIAKYYRTYTGELRNVKTFTDQLNISNPPAVALLYSRGILNGYNDGSFGADKSINRAESLKIILEALEIDPIRVNATEFYDVPANQWYTGYVNKAKSLGIVKGYTDGSFKPAGIVTQAELLKITLESFGINLDGYAVGDLPITLNSQDWYAVYYAYALDTELIEEHDTNPTQHMSRNDFTTLVYNLIIQQESL